MTAKYQALLTYFSGALGAAIGAATLASLLPALLSAPPVQWGVVDMQAVLARQAPALAHAGKLSRVQLQKITGQWQQQLHGFAIAHNLILVTKSSVLGGAVPDYTDEILTLLTPENPGGQSTGGHS